LFWCLFIGIGALGGSLMMFVDPMGESTGMNGFMPCFTVLPFADTLFKNLIFPGIALLFCNCLTNAAASVLIIKNNKYGPLTGAICGGVLMAWITIQFVIFPPNILSIAYFIFGILQLSTAVLLIYLIKKQKNRVERTS